MAKIRVHEDEYYPFPVLTRERYGTEIEVKTGTLRRWQRVFAEFDAVVDEIWAETEKQKEENGG